MTDTPPLESLTVTLDTGRALTAAGWDRPTVFSWYVQDFGPPYVEETLDPDSDKAWKMPQPVAPAPTLSEIQDDLREKGPGIPAHYDDAESAARSWLDFAKLFSAVQKDAALPESIMNPDA